MKFNKLLIKGKLIKIQAGTVKKRRDILKLIIYYFGILLLIAGAVFLSNIIYEIIYFKLKS